MKKLGRGLLAFVVFMTANLLFAILFELGLGLLLGIGPGKYENVMRAIAIGFLATTSAVTLMDLIWKYPRTALPIGVTVWFAANYALHFAFFPDNSDFSLYRQMVQNLTSMTVLWFDLFLRSTPPSERQ